MTPKFIILHHTAVSYNKNPDQFDATNNYHKGKSFPKSSLGFYVGYHYEISKAGIVRQARKENDVGAHCNTYNMNYQSIGVCLDGNFDIEMPTAEQVASLRKLLIEIIARHPGIIIKYHRNYAPKTCPGKLIADDWANKLILSDMKKIIGDKRDNKQYLVGDDQKIHWLFSPVILESFNSAGIIDKNQVEWRENLDGLTVGEIYGVVS